MRINGKHYSVNELANIANVGYPSNVTSPGAAWLLDVAAIYKNEHGRIVQAEDPVSEISELVHNGSVTDGPPDIELLWDVWRDLRLYSYDAELLYDRHEAGVRGVFIPFRDMAEMPRQVLREVAELFMLRMLQKEMTDA